MQATLRLELKTITGEVVATRQVHNAVMRAGARLVAELFAGRGAPITHMGVGTNATPETEAYNTTQLANETVGDLDPLGPPTEAAIPVEAFGAPEVDEVRRVVRIRVRGTLPAAAAVGTIREAGLLSRDGDTATLYNRVTFAPITKGDDHELTMFWEVSFPYGDLQWLM